MRNWVRFFLCLLLSGGIWLIHNLSQSYADIVSVPVQALSNIEGRARTSSSEAVVSARVRASGFRLLRLSRKHRRAVEAEFDAADFRHVEGDFFSVPTSSLHKYAQAIFGDDASVESFLSEDPVFMFTEEFHKKVPVRPVKLLSFASQHMPLREMRTDPDSVIIYGEPVRIGNIDQVLTHPLELRDLSSSVHGTVALEIPAGVRLSQDEVVYTVDVARYVELSSDVHVEVRNVPAGASLSVLPSTAAVTIRCMFPTGSDPFKKAVFYIDYNEFEGSLNGRCLLHADRLDASVIDWKSSPEVFDCVLKSQGRR